MRPALVTSECEVLKRSCVTSAPCRPDASLAISRSRPRGTRNNNKNKNNRSGATGARTVRPADSFDGPKPPPASHFPRSRVRSLSNGHFKEGAVHEILCLGSCTDPRTRRDKGGLVHALRFRTGGP
ncbi:hypothetical protein AAFF_G00435320 [Aldrovandia affinis]|uniref:Uncharacterized protein n=1 Tax=Aldrovandia affinis TaxID=143900 RepID=A0AAD7WIA6_9TELE|nr:hypothetical protein AAFF_G00435320 [Aldrovandia affinis]